MVEDLRAAFKELVTETQWMDSQTQVKYFFQKGFLIITKIETNYQLPLVSGIRILSLCAI